MRILASPVAGQAARPSQTWRPVTAPENAFLFTTATIAKTTGVPCSLTNAPGNCQRHPPPVFSYPSYPHLDPYRQSNYGTSPAYSSTYNDLSSFQGEYGNPVPSIMPVAMSSGGPLKRPHTYADEEIISPFSMSYATMAGIDLCPTSHHPGESNISVRNLSSGLHRYRSSKEKSKKADTWFIRSHLCVNYLLRISPLRRHPQRRPFSRVLSHPSPTRAPRIRFPFCD